MSFKTTVVEKLEEEAVWWFGSIQNEYFPYYRNDEVDWNEWLSEHKDKIEYAYYRNQGDGNLMEAVLKFNFEDGTDLIVKIDGTYSSWADSVWDEVYLAKPFTFTETRYERL